MTNNDRVKWLQLAYKMAGFIHGNKQIAYLIALEVACRWEVTPPQGQRPLSKDQKFQRLVFEVSEYFEKAIEAINVGVTDEVEEQVRRLALNMRHLEPTQQSIKPTARKYLSLLASTAANLKDRTMMMYYLKHLALMALRHSQLKTVVSFTQLLYRCSTSQAMSIYEYLENFLEKSGEVKDQQYYARARRELLGELNGRFSRLLRIEPHVAPNGAMTYQLTASPATPEQTEFIKECLRKFAPRDVRRSFSTPDIFENKGEFISQLLCPERFQVVLAESGLPTSPQPLFWPVFTNVERPASPAPPRQAPPLRDREINAALARLNRAAKRRRRLSGRLLRIVVDGCDAASLDLDDLDQPRECKLQVRANTSAIEVLARTEEGDILLAHFMLSEEDFDPTLRAPQFDVPLEGGRKIIFAIEPQTDGAAGQASIKYQESTFRRMMRKFRLMWEQFTIPLIPEPEHWVGYAVAMIMARASVNYRNSVNYWKWPLALASSCLTVFLGLAALQAVMFSTVTTNNIPPPALGAIGIAGGSPPPGTLGGPVIAAASNPSDSGKRRRLCEIHDLRIEMNGGNSQLYEAVKSQLAHKLSSPDIGLSVATDKAEMGATLKIKASWRYGVLGRISDTTVIEVGLYLTTGDNQGYTLWPAATNGRQYIGNSEDVIEIIASNLNRAKREDCKK